MNSVKLKGITWGHSRGLVPLVATGQRFNELHPHIDVQWHKRSLQAFADQSVEALAKDYDLLVIDHPSIGEAQAKGLFLPLDQYLSSSFLNDQAHQSVGASHLSYQYAGHQWALAIDAATPVSAARTEVLQKAGREIPQSWQELIDLAQSGLVAFAGLKLDCLMHFYTLCVAEGGSPFCQESELVDSDVAAAALNALKQLTQACGSDCLKRNPIAVYELMTTGDSHGYSPFAYGYSNYARQSYVDKPLVFGGLVQRHGRTLTSTLGGCGLAVSVFSQHQEQALKYAEFLACERIQKGLFTAAGGQAGHRSAWLDAHNNQLSNNYFLNTLPTLDAAYVRPRYNGYIHFQEQAPDVLMRFLQGEASLSVTIQNLNELDKRWRQGRINDALQVVEGAV
jgi:multiple sugar transport system substrate-binding protein